MLNSMIALLLSFASLADRVALRALPIRCFVLWVLRYAEIVAHAFVFGHDDDDQLFRPLEACLMAFTGYGCAAEAQRLARSFRLLARDLRRQQQMEHRLLRNTQRRQIRDQKLEKLFDIAGRPAFASGASTNAPPRRIIQFSPLPLHAAVIMRWRALQAGFT